MKAARFEFKILVGVKRGLGQFSVLSELEEKPGED